MEFLLFKNHTVSMFGSQYAENCEITYLYRQEVSVIITFLILFLIVFIELTNSSKPPPV
jgi:hypothetical protein